MERATLPSTPSAHAHPTAQIMADAAQLTLDN